MDHQNLLTEKEQDILYLVHHMHHLKNGDDVVHELHHCFLFSKEDMQGEKFTIDHLLLDNKLYHVLDKESPEVLYDHTNNSFEVQKVEINSQQYYTIG